MLAMMLALLIANRFTRRIESLRRSTRRIADGDFRPMPAHGWRDELHELTHTWRDELHELTVRFPSGSINEMAERLAQLQQTLRQTERLRLLGQVGGGLAHHLRNSVAGARLALQLHARECPPSSEHQALEVALRELSLIEGRLHGFLTLGAGDRDQESPCDLARLLDEAVALVRPRCRHLETELDWQLPQRECTVQGNCEQLSHLFLNLLGNAIDAAGTEGKVAVRWQQGTEPSSTVVVEILDNGPGPPAAIAERLFEPFVSGKPAGVGLGLALAKQTAENHRGTISWRREDGRTCFVVTLPAVSGRKHGSSLPQA